MRVRVVAGVLAVALTAAGCGAPEQARPVSADATASAPRPGNVQDPAEIPSRAPVPTCDPRASLRPEGALPRPGAMPAGSTMADIVANGRLVVGIDQNAYLFGFRDPATGELAGFEVDMAREIARALFGDPRKVQFRAITTADRIPVLRNNEVDLVIRTMTMTCERWQQVSFSTEYIASRQRLLVRKADKIRDFADLHGRKVCATRGSTSIVTIHEQPGDLIPVSTDSTLDCLVMLQQHQVDAVSTIDILLAGLAAQDPTTMVTGKPVSNEPSGIGIPKNKPDMVRYVNGVLATMRADGTWTRVYDRWLRARLGPATPPKAVYQD
ncbi:glutamate ABC transporter substrate-binding protein [Actinoplanes derwentensis]|uniref:Amino acid ABC transporter substrate-binding protein, PAAT family n=1 Tax=Actinoplanes derwentensis TaxID=113562 RepID=A0A1H2B3E6_9ACTN|nr:glutamate ABC transporter substrate-binding protein [Actinoplanes derwentensis]GID87567.1 ABC transporter substrate-binding protein [Actinoplanes derwentensis]SDT52479.1 amino acid ABC transporter substrate-binding protein, PAAT family [Actinoplanes derwentensis]